MRRSPVPHHPIRGLVLAALATSLLAMAASPAAAGGRHSPATITVSSTDCVQVAVSSSKSISNVVLEFSDHDRQKFEDLPESRTGTFAGTGDNSGEVVTAAWVKSGNNKSGDGPGYGERLAVTCTSDDREDPKEPAEPKEPVDPKDPDDPKDPEEPTDPDDPVDPDDDGGDPTDVPPTPQDINDPVDELPDGETATGDDFDDAVLNAVDESDPGDQDPQVLGVQESNDVVTAAATDQLPAAGAGAWTTLLAALVSIALGGTLLRRTSSTRRTPA